MARIDKHHFDRDLAFVNGIVEGIEIVKQIFELTVEERLTMFDESDVAMILDKYNFAEIFEALRGIK